MKVHSDATVLFLIVVAGLAGSQALEPVVCNNPYALCAFANCTVNPDGLTASCGCYSFPQPADSTALVDLIPDTQLQAETRRVCSSSTTGCDVDEAPVCAAIGDGELWPTADLVSTYSKQMEQENGVNVYENGTYYDPWMCSAAPGRFVPVCMLAPCLYSEPATNPYNDGVHNMTCTCPLVEVTVDYVVFGGLQNPCSSEMTAPGDWVQATGGAVLETHAINPAQVEASWMAVTEAFGGNDSSSTSGGKQVLAVGVIQLAVAVLSPLLLAMSL